MTTLHQLILDHGVREEHDNHNPFWLSDAGSAWLVAEGAVDVFWVHRGEDDSPGPRRYFARTSVGGLVLGADFSALDAASGFLAVATVGTVLYRVPLSQLESLGRDSDATAQELLAMADAWVSVFSRGLPRHLPPPTYEVLAADQPLRAAAGACISPSDRMVWMRLAEGRVAFMGEPGASLSAASTPPPVPLRNDIWFTVLDAALAEPVAARDLLDQGLLWHSLSGYQNLGVAYLLVRIRAEEQDEAARLQDKATRAEAAMDAALRDIIDTATGTPRRIAGAQTDDPLLAACQLIGKRLGVEFQAPKRYGNDERKLDPVQEMAEASLVRVRTVALKAEWWNSDNGPLLATLREGNRWVALISLRDKHYELHDPASGTVRRVDAEVAAELGDFAHSFYRSFPAKPLDALGLLRFGVHGLWRDIVWVVALAVLMGILGTLIPIASGKLIDTLIPSADQPGILQVMAALIVAAITTALFGVARSIAVLRVESKMDGAVQAAIWDRVLRLPVTFFRQYTAGDLAVRVNGINTIRHALSGSTVGTLLTGVFSMFNFGLLFYYNSTLAFVALGLTAVAIVVSFSAGLLALRYQRQVSAVAGKLSGTVFQYLTGITKIRVAAAENRAFANWATEFTQLRRLTFGAEHVGNVEGTFYSGYGMVVTGVIFAMVGMLAAKNDGATFATGEFVAFSSAFGAFFGALLSLSSTVLDLLNLVPVYERAKPIMSALPESDKAKAQPGLLSGGIEVVKVGFRYGEGAEVLKDVSFSIRPGGYIALVGPSGSGKSTLFRLLLGFEKASTGSVYYDNQNLADLDAQAVRRQIGVVLQGGQLMTGDIFTNIVGSSTLTVDDAWAAARMCGLEEDIKKMPMGMHTVISEGSSTLSGGQRQRILIARAIVHKPRILYFDEATSALDNRTQAIVSESLDKLKSTRVVIAHRLSTVINADRIIVLVDGRVVQNGTYQELVNQPGPFAELAKRQIA
jgi:NHLM bacteriocin system ABC transporter ATP-binding protein